MSEPVTTAAIALKLGEGLLGWRRGKQEEARRARQEALNKLIGSLSERQQPNQQQYQPKPPGVIESIMGDDLIQGELAKMLGPAGEQLLDKYLGGKSRVPTGRPKLRDPYGRDPYQ